MAERAERERETVIEVGSLDDLEVLEAPVILHRPDGKTLRLMVRSLTQDELLGERKAVKWPTAPQHMVPSATKGGRPQMVANLDDPGYQDALGEANAEYAYRVVMRALLGGGVRIPGETDDERLAHVRARLGAWAMRALAEVLARFHGLSEAEIESVGKA